MGKGRWYPTVTTLPTGAALVVSGSYRDTVTGQDIINVDNQIWSQTGFASVTSLPNTTTLPSTGPFPLYPRIHIASSGLVYLDFSPDILSLDLAAPNRQWSSVKSLQGREASEYGCSVMYEKDKVLFVGGRIPPIATADVLDLSVPAWEPTNAMNFPRRQHNATVLPDGSVLVTGGTRGEGFNDLRPGRPVHIAELWDPKTKQWTLMASEKTDRCYHSTAVLLPDGRVLSAGGGEFQVEQAPKVQAANNQQDSHRDAQIFSPPYLFQDGPRPQIISSSKDKIECGSTFDVTTSNPDQIDRISLVGLSSVTHSINTGQRLQFLNFKREGDVLKVFAPPNARSSPPGYYMLFILNKKGVPSIAKMVQIMATREARIRHQGFTANLVAERNKPPTVLQMRSRVRETVKGTHATRVEIGITPTCPYGLSACWGGAFKALSYLDGVKDVDPIPHRSGSTASVFLKDDGLPDLNLWTKQFHDYVRETYGLRGFEMALIGIPEKRDNGFILRHETRPEVRLVHLEAGGKVQWDKDAGRPQAITEEEASEYDKLIHLTSSDDTDLVTVTGPVSQTEAGYTLQVRSIR
jgi:hypothetical protein